MMFVRSSGRSKALRALLPATVWATSCISSLASSPASAEVYNDTFNVAVDSLRCGYFVQSQLCAVALPFEGGAREARTGDKFTAQVNLDRPLTVRSSTGGAAANAVLIDNSAFLGGLAPGPYETTSTMTLEGYSGPALTLSGPLTLSGNFGYPAFAGVCCGAPSEPFTFSGAKTDFDILSDGLLPIAGLAFGYVVELAATPQTLSDFQGGNPGAPVLLPQGLIGEITGQIGGDYGPNQFYGFEWEGGLFQTQATIFDADPTMAFNFELFSMDDIGEFIASVKLKQENNFDALLSATLDPGRYKIGLATSDIPDPSFRIRFLTPVGLSGAVPEPSTWAMMLLGFGFVGGALRAAKRRSMVSVSYA